MYLDVPFVSQLGFGGSLNRDDPTGCWYASACMVAYSFEAGPRLGVPQLYSRPITQPDGSAGTGHWAMELGWVPTLMKNEHLAKLDGGLPRDAGDLLLPLKKWGPLFVAWWKTNAKGQSYGHISVLIGAWLDGTIMIHDPENAPRTVMKYADFLPRHDKMAGDKQQWWPTLRRDAAPFSYAGNVTWGSKPG